MFFNIVLCILFENQPKNVSLICALGTPKEFVLLKVFFQVIRVDASDEDCSPHYGDICGYEIESQGQPFSISKEGKYTAN